MAEIKKVGLDIDLDETVAQGAYSNLAIISHSASEFILDFAAILPGVAKAKVKSRIILTPEHAKRLLLSLQENVTRYESDMGKIEISKHQTPGTSGPQNWSWRVRREALNPDVSGRLARITRTFRR